MRKIRKKQKPAAVPAEPATAPHPAVNIGVQK